MGLGQLLSTLGEARLLLIRFGINVIQMNIYGVLQSLGVLGPLLDVAELLLSLSLNLNKRIMVLLQALLVFVELLPVLIQ